MAAVREVGGFASLRNLAAVCGGLAGVGGIVHGVGEVLQERGPRSGDRVRLLGRGADRREPRG